MIFSKLIKFSPSAFAFLGGIQASFSTGSFSSVLLAHVKPENIFELLLTGVITMLAAIAWFWSGERILSHLKLIEFGIQGGIAEEQIIAKFTKKEQNLTEAIFSVALFCTLAWPIVTFIDDIREPIIATNKSDKLGCITNEK